MIYKNMTPHAVNIFSKGRMVSLKSDGVCRANFTNDIVDFAVIEGLSVPIKKIVYEYPTNLPMPKEGVTYIVSSVTAAACKEVGRTTEDLLVPANLIRDEKGQVIGITSFIRV